MRTDQGGLFEFGIFRLDATERRLLREGHPVSLTPKAFHTLVLLVENRGHVLRKDELIRSFRSLDGTRCYPVFWSKLFTNCSRRHRG